MRNRLSCAEFLKAFPRYNSTIGHRQSRAQFLLFTYQARSEYAQPCTNNSMTVFLYCFCITLIFLCLWSVSVALPERVHQIKRLHQIRCSDWELFTNEYPLKCTVRSWVICTEEAIGCTDFEPKIYFANAYPQHCSKLSKNYAKIPITTFSVTFNKGDRWLAYSLAKGGV